MTNTDDAAQFLSESGAFEFSTGEGEAFSFGHDEEGASFDFGAPEDGETQYEFFVQTPDGEQTLADALGGEAFDDQPGVQQAPAEEPAGAELALSQPEETEPAEEAPAPYTDQVDSSLCPTGLGANQGVDASKFYLQDFDTGAALSNAFTGAPYGFEDAEVAESFGRARGGRYLVLTGAEASAKRILS